MTDNDEYRADGGSNRDEKFPPGLTEEDISNGIVRFSMTEPAVVSGDSEVFVGDVPGGEIDDRLEAIVEDIVEWDKSSVGHSVKLNPHIWSAVGRAEDWYDVRGKTNVLTALIVHGHQHIHQKFSDQIETLEEYRWWHEDDVWETHQDGGNSLWYQQLGDGYKRYHTNNILSSEISKSADVLGLTNSAYVRQCVAKPCIDLPVSSSVNEALEGWNEKFEDYVQNRVMKVIDGASRVDGGH